MLSVHSIVVDNWNVLWLTKNSNFSNNTQPIFFFSTPTTKNVQQLKNKNWQRTKIKQFCLEGLNEWSENIRTHGFPGIEMKINEIAS